MESTNNPPPKAEDLIPRQFDHVYLAILRRPDDAPTLSDEDLEANHVGHLAHLTTLKDMGKALVAGPFGEQDDPHYRGIILLRVSSKSEARELVDQDPAVKIGRFKADLMKWSFEKGRMTFPMEPRRSD